MGGERTGPEGMGLLEKVGRGRRASEARRSSAGGRRREEEGSTGDSASCGIVGPLS
jgi:hypothetical protein